MEKIDNDEKRNILFNYFFEEFFKNGLVNLIHKKDVYPFYKQYRIFQSLPFKMYNIKNDWKKNNYMNYIAENYGEPIWHKGIPIHTCFYMHLNYLFDEYNITTDNCKKQVSNIVNFALENKGIMTVEKDIYGDAYEQFEIYKSLVNKRNDKGLKEINKLDKDIAESANKIGELIIAEKMFYAGKDVYHVSKKLGNGFGYKIYEFNKDEKKEILHDVKTTMVDSNNIKLQDNTIILSNKEFEFIKKVLNEKPVDFIIDNVYINKNSIYKTYDLNLQVKKVKSSEGEYSYFLVSPEDKTVYKQDTTVKDSVVFKGREKKKVLLS